jgi:hypothetical protein
LLTNITTESEKTYFLTLYEEDALRSGGFTHRDRKHVRRVAVADAVDARHKLHRGMKGVAHTAREVRPRTLFASTWYQLLRRASSVSRTMLRSFTGGFGGGPRTATSITLMFSRTCGYVISI